MASLLMVVIGIVYAVMNVDAEDATAFLVVAVAVGLASGDGGALTHIPAVGGQLNGALGALSLALYAGVAVVAATRIVNRLKG